MKPLLFFFYLLALGVFAQDIWPVIKSNNTISTFLSSFNASEVKTQRTEINLTYSNRNYVSLGIEIYERYANYNWYSHSITYNSPNLPNTYLSANGIIPWDDIAKYPPSQFQKLFRFEPCVFKSNPNDLFNSTYNVHIKLDQEVLHFPSNMQVNMTANIVLEDTLVVQDPITGTFPRTIWPSDYYYGEYRYRTIKMSGSSEIYETKDLVIQFSVDLGSFVTGYIDEVIFATGGQCIWNYDLLTEDRFVRQVSRNYEYPSPPSLNFTIPARDLWYIAFKPSHPVNIYMDVILVDRPQPVPKPVPKPDPTTTPAPKPKEPTTDPNPIPNPKPDLYSSSYIPCLDYNLIVVFILSLLIFHK